MFCTRTKSGSFQKTAFLHPQRSIFRRKEWSAGEKLSIAEQRTENREQRTENREQRTENREQRSENREQRSEIRERTIVLAGKDGVG
jgi:hypothetical protein